MIQPTFPRTQGSLSRETYLTLLILGLLQQAGGELHLSAQSLESIDSGCSLLVDWDTTAQKLILRAGTSSLVISPVKGTGWTTTNPQPKVEAPPANHRVMTEEEILSRLQKRMQDDQMKQWKAAGAEAVAGMPEPA